MSFSISRFNKELSRLKRDFYKLIETVKPKYETDIVIELAKKTEDEILQMFYLWKWGNLHKLIEEFGNKNYKKYYDMAEDAFDYENRLLVFKNHKNLPCLIYYLYCLYNDKEFITSGSLHDYVLINLSSQFNINTIVYEYLKEFSNLSTLDKLCCEIYKNEIRGINEEINYVDVSTGKARDVIDQDRYFNKTLLYKLYKRVFEYNKDINGWNEKDLRPVYEIVNRYYPDD